MLKYDILVLPETRRSSDDEMLHYVPSYVRDNMFNAYKQLDFSVMHEHLETIFVPFSFVEISYAICNIYRLPNTNNDELMPELSVILNNAFIDFPFFCIMGDFN